MKNGKRKGVMAAVLCTRKLAVSLVINGYLAASCSPGRFREVGIQQF